MLVTNYCARSQKTSCISLEHILSCYKRKSYVKNFVFFFKFTKNHYNENYNERKPQLRKYNETKP